MGRTLKRVPLDFNYPKDEIWEGYLCPYVPLPCSQCEGKGESPEVRKLYDRWYGWDRQEKWVWCDETHRKRWNKAAWNNNLSKKDVQALLDANRLWDFTRVPRNKVQAEVVKRKIASGQNSWLPYHNGYTPTPQEVNQWNRDGFGHDSIDAWIVVKAKAQRLGLPLECDKCQGEGHFWPSDEVKAAYEAWQPSEPPIGEGYQLWETTSEGSPQSPVFASLDELCIWCERNATTFADFQATAQEWESMLGDDFVHHHQGNIVLI